MKKTYFAGKGVKNASNFIKTNFIRLLVIGMPLMPLACEKEAEKPVKSNMQKFQDTRRDYLAYKTNHIELEYAIKKFVKEKDVGIVLGRSGAFVRHLAGNYDKVLEGIRYVYENCGREDLEYTFGGILTDRNYEEEKQVVKEYVEGKIGKEHLLLYFKDKVMPQQYEKYKTDFRMWMGTLKWGKITLESTLNSLIRVSGNNFHNAAYFLTYPPAYEHYLKHPKKVEGKINKIYMLERNLRKNIFGKFYGVYFEGKMSKYTKNEFKLMLRFVKGQVSIEKMKKEHACPNYFEQKKIDREKNRLKPRRQMP
ncbi:hypothetical protein COU37_03765 [Candidatus Micrarchaeota archaeon CG10_big_fil_rev_8_21_14_0_10_45_29]|nr:MAG: hypothetical protein COU37_03765 [Candidatus Micrarchaeota archaeon CG10_big_fil_rev_8_21_14_0_10_45_29]